MGTERGHLIKHSKCTATNGRSVCVHRPKNICLDFALQARVKLIVSIPYFLLQMDYILIMNGHGEHEN